MGRRKNCRQHECRGDAVVSSRQREGSQGRRQTDAQGKTRYDPSRISCTSAAVHCDPCRVWNHNLHSVALAEWLAFLNWTDPRAICSGTRLFATAHIYAPQRQHFKDHYRLFWPKLYYFDNILNNKYGQNGGERCKSAQKGAKSTNKSQIFIAFYMRSDIFRQKSKYVRPLFYIKYGGNKRRMYAKGRNGGNAAEVVSVPFGVKMTATGYFHPIIPLFRYYSK